MTIDRVSQALAELRTSPADTLTLDAVGELLRAITAELPEGFRPDAERVLVRAHEIEEPGLGLALLAQHADNVGCCVPGLSPDVRAALAALRDMADAAGRVQAIAALGGAPATRGLHAAATTAGGPSS
jgi:hypothetical protein